MWGGGRGQIEIFFYNSFITVYSSLNTEFHVSRPAGSGLIVCVGEYSVEEEQMVKNCIRAIIIITLNSLE